MMFLNMRLIFYMTFWVGGRGVRGEMGGGKQKKPLSDNTFKMASKFRDRLGIAYGDQIKLPGRNSSLSGVLVDAMG